MEGTQKSDRPQNPSDAADDSDANSEVEEQEKALVAKTQSKRKKKGLQAFEQRDLVALAFARTPAVHSDNKAGHNIDADEQDEASHTYLDLHVTDIDRTCL